MKKWVIIIASALVLSGAFIAWRAYNYIYSPNVQLANKELTIHVPTGADIQTLTDSLIQYNALKNVKSFNWVARLMSFSTPKPGSYKIADNWSNKELVGLLRSGAQEAVTLTFNNVRTVEELCALFGKELEPSKDEFISHIYSSELLDGLSLDSFNVLSLFIPNTYKIFWNSSPKSLVERMATEHSKFWNEERSAKLVKIGLSKQECYTLASIIQKETNLKSEKPVMAGVYLNRLKKNMLLQADPTVVFAVGDFEIRRVLNKHLEIDSPYNTYKYEGLPPGPIGMPDIETIDAVLNAEQHNYLYFCVKPGTGFEHAFASTLRQHMNNARAYQRWLNQQRIFN